jgi:hypothetical protein
MHAYSPNCSDHVSLIANKIPHAKAPAFTHANQHANLQADLPPPKKCANLTNLAKLTNLANLAGISRGEKCAPSWKSWTSWKCWVSLNQSSRHTPCAATRVRKRHRDCACYIYSSTLDSRLRGNDGAGHSPNG